MTKEDKLLDLINEYKIHDKVSAPKSPLHRTIETKVQRFLDCYGIVQVLNNKGNRDYSTSYQLKSEVGNTLRKIIRKYNPKATSELAREKEIQVNGTNKKGIKTGKRTVMKFGRWLGQAFPFLTDGQKEKLVNWYFNGYGPIDATFHRATTGFKSIVTKPMGKRVGFDTTKWQKSLADSCMRYKAKDLGLSKHPYSAYESGDWELCYLLDEDHSLLGRCLVNLPTGTHSAIYGTSNSAIQLLQDEMGKLGYTRVSYEAEEWSGSKLLYIEDSWYNRDERVAFPVLLMPYVDIFEGFAYHDYTYIYLSVSDSRPKGTREVDPFEASGVNEL